MDERVIRQLTRQLKLLNFWVSFFGVLFLICFVVAGILAYKAVQEVRKAENNVSNFQQQASQDLNFKNQLCSSSNSVSSLIKKTDACN